MRKVTFSPGEFLFRQGDQTYFFFMIEEGEVDVLIQDPKGGEVLLATVGSGQPVGEFALITRTPRVASARAKSQTVAIQISQAGYEKLLAELPDWAVSLITELVERLKKTDQRLAELQARTSGST